MLQRLSFLFRLCATLYIKCLLDRNLLYLCNWECVWMSSPCTGGYHRVSAPPSLFSSSIRFSANATGMLSRLSVHQTISLSIHFTVSSLARKCRVLFYIFSKSKTIRFGTSLDNTSAPTRSIIFTLLLFKN